MDRFLRTTALISLGILVLALPAAACLWDDDTLRAEAKGLPGIAEIITGRFERNPPLYYQMRLERSRKDIESDPQNWEAYDNAGVACDRLGRHDEAIQWMAHKKAALDAAVADQDSQHDHRYRYLANLGTFHAHRWFGSGAQRDDLSDMQRGIQLIEAAIALNPDAHFGRERYQLMAMRWIVDPPDVDEERLIELPTLFLADGGYRTAISERGPFGNLNEAGLGDAVQGLSGLIALGNAWESVDVFFALAVALSKNMDSGMAYLAKQRCIELIRSGKTSLHPAMPSGEELVEMIYLPGNMTTEAADIDAYFVEARASADAWRENRTEFMLARLVSGGHPDSDSSFWDGYVAVEAVALPNGTFGLSDREVVSVRNVTIITAVGLLIGVGVIRWMRSTRSTP